MFSNTKIGINNINADKKGKQSHTFAKIIAGSIMESTLVVKNFGPIKDVNLNLRNVNVFIGPQASGKSALAKIYTIFKAPRKFFYKYDSEKNEKLILDAEKASKEVKDVFEEYNISSFLKPSTEIIFDSELHKISYINGQLLYEPKLYKTIESLEVLTLNFSENKEKIIEGYKTLAGKFILFSLKANLVLKNEDEPVRILADAIQNVNNDNCSAVIDAIKSTEKELSTNTAIYIPAERNFINIIKKSLANLIVNKVPIPKHILSFAAELEKLDIKEIDLDFIQKKLVYKIVNGDDRIYIDNENSILLTEAASGIQSVVPVLAPILSKAKDSAHRSFVIEEPELNLFPLAQYELIQRLESNRNDPYWDDYGTIHTYTTHSPYILSALNNLLYAHKVKTKLNAQSINDGTWRADTNEENTKKVKEIVKATINPESFTAYQISEGKAVSIFNSESGLIEDNYIDQASDKLNEDFEELMEMLP